MYDWATTRLNVAYHWKSILLWALGIGGAIVFSLWPARAEAWVKHYQAFPNGEATIVLHRFCLSADCGSLNENRWKELIDTARRTWNNAGSDFIFHVRSSRATDDPCNLPGEVVIIVSNDGSACPGDTFRNYGEIGGRTEFGRGDRARVYIRTTESEPHREVLLYLVHEFGHVVGLGHPDEHGQNVLSVMNSTVLGITVVNGKVQLTSDDPLDPSLQQDDIDGIIGLYGQYTAIGMQGNPPSIESGQVAVPQSGIGVISGWACKADWIEIVIYDLSKQEGEAGYRRSYTAAYGTERLDTEGVCGDTDNGFGLLFNWNNLGDGEYLVVTVIHGRGSQGLIALPHARVKVTTLGEEFLRGAKGEYVLEDFPELGQSVTVEWLQESQNFVIANFDIGEQNSCVARLVRTHVDGIDLAVRYNCGTQTFTIRRAPARAQVCREFFYARQDGIKYQQDNFEWSYAPCEGRYEELTLSVKSSSSLDLSRPFELRYRGKVVFTQP